MAIISCPNCNNRISNKQQACPECGFGLKGKDSGLSATEAGSSSRSGSDWLLQAQSYAATLLFIVGFATWWTTSDGLQNPPAQWSIWLLAGGMVWYLVVRGMRVWRGIKRRRK